MSRIHEALKRAEEDRAAGRVLPDNPAGLATEPSLQVIPVLQQGEQLGGTDTLVSELDQSVQVENATYTGASLSERLAQLPASKWDPLPNMLFFNDLPDIHCVEEFRTLRTRLYRIRERKALKTILVGSALPGEGKTFVASNLAQVLARQHGRRVLLIDGDLRKAALHRCFGTNAHPGLSDYLSGKCGEVEAIQRGQSDNLYFLPAGNEVSNPPELIGNGRMKQLIDRLSPVFEWIVIDSSPVVPVADATLLASVTDGVLLVLHAATTPFDLAQQARKEFSQFPLLGAILNRIPYHEKKQGYYYDNGGYRALAETGVANS